MSEHRLLYLSPYRLTAFRREVGVLHSEGRFEASADGHRLFAAYLAPHTKSLFSLLINAAEEDFRIETLPFLHGAYRRSIIQRKLGQLFFNAPLTSALSLGHETSRRKNEHVLFAALLGQEYLQPWLHALQHAQIALAGIYSLPFLGATLLEKLKITDERCLLLTVQDQSLRQSYFEKGQLHFSRLTPLPSSGGSSSSSSSASSAQNFASEAHKLQQYLSSQRMIVGQQPLTVHLLAHSSARQAIASVCVDTPTLHYKLLPLENCAKKLGMRAQAVDSDSEMLFLHLLASAPPRTQFANDEQRHPYHLRWLRRALYAIGALVLAGGLLLAGKQTLDTFGIEQETGQRAIEAEHARQRYARITQTFPPLPTDYATLRRSIDRYEALENERATPDQLYRSIGRALNTPAASAIRLDEIDWTFVALPRDETGAEIGVDTGAETDTGSNSVAPDKGGKLREIAIVGGSVQLAATATPRQVLAAFNPFLDTLKSDPRLHLLVLQPPVDLESSQGVNGERQTTVDADNRHRFRLQIGRKRGS
jgi:hypothetical protein